MDKKIEQPTEQYEEFDYLSDFYFKDLKDRNVLKNDKIYELKSFVLNNLNKYLTFNLNQNSLINAINNKLNYG